MNRAQLKRRQQDRDQRNAEARLLLPKQQTPEERKARAERIMAAHDAELEGKAA